MQPVISPYYKQSGYVHCGCCCDPYQIFANIASGYQVAQQNLVFNFLFSDPILPPIGMPMLVQFNQQNQLYFVNASKKQLP